MISGAGTSVVQFKKLKRNPPARRLDQPPARAGRPARSVLRLVALGPARGAPKTTDREDDGERRETVEHPFGTLKMRMGATHFLMKRPPKVVTEMALHVAYNVTRVMNIVGIQPLIAGIRA